jgi:hypothetical protein
MRRLGYNIMYLYYNVMAEEQQIEEQIEEQIQEQQEQLKQIQKEYEMEIMVEPLQIMIQTNVPSQPNFEFTSNLIHIPEEEPPIKRERLNNYPYLCTNFRYPSVVLMSLPYNTIVEFFFNADTMISLMNSSKVQSFEKRNKTELERKYHQTEVEEHNIQLMIKLLFPTKFLIPINLHQSIDIVLNSSTFPHNFFFNPNQIRYSYMKLGNEVYTTSRVTWINDLLNHKHFSTLMKKTYFANKALRKNAVEANIVDLQKKKFNTHIERLTKELAEKEQELEDNYNEYVEAFESTIRDYKKENKELFEDEGSDSEYHSSDGESEKIETTQGRPRELRPRENIKRPERFRGGTDTFTSETFKIYITEQLDSFLDEIKEDEQEAKDQIKDHLQYDIALYSDNIYSLNREIEVLRNELEEKKKLAGVAEPFKDTPYEKLEPPINAHNIYIRNMLKMNLSKDIPSRNVKDFYDKILPLFIRIRDRKDNELTSGNRYFKDLLNGGIGKKKPEANKVKEKIQDFYNTMNSVYRKYIRNDTSVSIKKERKVLYTGVDEIYFKFPKPGTPRRRVFFTIELIEGAVNDENRDRITCPYTGEYLGVLFEKLFYGQSMFGWKVKPAEYLYSVKKEIAEYSKSNVREGEQERKEAREEIMQIREDAEAPLFELTELTKLFEPERKRDGEASQFDQKVFDEFFEIIINDYEIQEQFESAQEYGIYHPKNKQLYITSHEKTLGLGTQTRLLKQQPTTNGLLQELSKYYNSDSTNEELKNSWEQYRTLLETRQKQLTTKIDDPDMNDTTRRDIETRLAIANYLLTIMEKAHKTVPHFFQ